LESGLGLVAAAAAAAAAAAEASGQRTAAVALPAPLLQLVAPAPFLRLPPAPPQNFEVKWVEGQGERCARSGGQDAGCEQGMAQLGGRIGNRAKGVDGSGSGWGGVRGVLGTPVPTAAAAGGEAVGGEAAAGARAAAEAAVGVAAVQGVKGPAAAVAAAAAAGMAAASATKGCLLKMVWSCPSSYPRGYKSTVGKQVDFLLLLVGPDVS